MNFETIITNLFKRELSAFKEEIKIFIQKTIKKEDNPKMLLKEAALFLGIAPTTLKNKFQNGLIKGYKPSQEIYFFKNDLIRYIQSKGSNQLVFDGNKGLIS